MADIPENQVKEWLKKLERESWQLELLVSAFTIFLLIGANSAYKEFLNELPFRYNTDGPFFSFASIFLIIIGNSIMALTIFLIIHLMLRGFWIGTIGLRSVQSTIDFEKLRYNEFFTDKLRSKVISLDKMVVRLDEICSVIFAFSFLIISVLIAFGTYLGFLGLIGAVLSWLSSLFDGILSTFFIMLTGLTVIAYLIMGFIYMIDYLSLGFFKKLKWFSKIYYPFYRLFSFVTLSGLSRSIYYYLISKFSKNKIRLVYTGIAVYAILVLLFDYDNHVYYPSADSDLEVTYNYYDNRRPDEDYIHTVSISSDFIDQPFFPLFLRYDPRDNNLISSHCPDFEPLKSDGFNSGLGFYDTDPGFQITSKDYSKEDFDQLLKCHCSLYQITINDSTISNLKYKFYRHPSKEQMGLLTVIPTEKFIMGENLLKVNKVVLDSAGISEVRDYVSIPFWYQPN